MPTRDANGKFIGGVAEPKPADGSEAVSTSAGEPETVGGNGAVDFGAIDAERDDTRGGGGHSSSREKRGRGRPKGSAKKETNHKADLKEPPSPKPRAEFDLDGISYMLLSLHSMAAVAFKATELSLSESEGKELSKCLVNVAEFYNVAPSPKLQAWMALIMCCGVIYYPRVTMINERLKMEKATRLQQRAQSA